MARTRSGHGMRGRGGQAARTGGWHQAGIRPASGRHRAGIGPAPGANRDQLPAEMPVKVAVALPLVWVMVQVPSTPLPAAVWVPSPRAPSAMV